MPAGPAEPTPGSDRRADKWLVTSVAVVAALVVTGAVALVVSGGHSPRVTAPPASTATRASTTVTGPPGGSGTTHTSQPSPPSSPPSTTTTTLPSAPGAAPVISSLTPSSGTAGQVVQVRSQPNKSERPDGGEVKGQLAPTKLPVPDNLLINLAFTPPGSAAAQVTITTASGTSNAVTFTYD